MAVELPQDLNELAELINQASALYSQLQQAAQTEKAEAQAAVRNAITNLENLLGPVDEEPSQNSIRGVLAYGKAVIVANPGTAFMLILQGLEILVQNQIDLAKALK